MGNKEIKFYNDLLGMVDREMELLKINPNHFASKNYFISRQTYYNLQSIANKKGTKKRLKHETLELICDHFGYKLSDVDYILTKK